ncbi:MAG: hypothetical protein WCG63_06260 [Opitutaceae bacterium]
MGKSAASISTQPSGLVVAAVLSVVMGTASGALLLTINPLAKLTAKLQLEAPISDVVYYRKVKRDYLAAWITSDIYKWFPAGYSVRLPKIDLKVHGLTALKSSGSFSNDSSLSLTI